VALKKRGGPQGWEKKGVKEGGKKKKKKKYPPGKARNKVGLNSEKIELRRWLRNRKTTLKRKKREGERGQVKKQRLVGFFL